VSPLVFIQENRHPNKISGLACIQSSVKTTHPAKYITGKVTQSLSFIFNSQKWQKKQSRTKKQN